MKRLLRKASALVLLAIPFAGSSQCSDLFFSEYIEGTSLNKAIEIYNPTSSKIGLSDYEVRLYSNGSSSASSTLTFAPTDSIGAFDVYVISNGSASLAGITSNSDVVSGVTSFNGDDAIELYKVSSTSSIDIIGTIGSDPGSSWSITGTNSVSGSTVNNTLVRDPSIQQGQTNWTTSSASEWLVLPLDMADSTGTHTSTCASASSSSITASFAVTDASCGGGTNGAIDLTVSGGVAPYTFVWSNAATTEDINGLAVGTYSVTITDANAIIVVDSASVAEINTISISFTELNPVSCGGNNDGILIASASGGAGGYTYSWSNAKSTGTNLNIGIGTYTVTVTDANSCTDTASYTMSAPPAIAITGVVTNESNIGANDGAIDISVANGTAPYTYSWSNSATTEDIMSLSAGTYTVTVSGTGSCVNSASFTVASTTPLSAAISSQTNVDCNGNSTGSLKVTAAGGVAPYTYLWSNAATMDSITSLSAATYTVTVTDANSNTATASAVITAPAQLFVSGVISNNNTIGSSNGAVDITVSGGMPPYSYAWSNAATTEDITSLAAGTYTVTLSDANGCTLVSSYNVIQPSGPPAEIVITEIMYNGPEAGADTSEFIEFLNAGSTAVDITGYSISEGVSLTFTSGLIAPGEYFVIAFDSSAFRNTYGVGANFQWTSGLLSNSGEDIVLVDNFGRTVDSVDYDDGGSWPSGSGAGQADGGGASIILCDSTLDNNLGASWSSAISPVSGVIVNGFQVFANPGTGGVCSLPMSIVMVNDSNVTCNAGTNGGASVNVTGGLSPITYLWSNSATTASITGVAAGTYTVTVTDALNSSLVDSVVITEPTAIMVTDVITNATVNGASDGSINITVSGGTPAYTYAWNTTDTTEDLSAIGAGAYTVTITDLNGCTSINTYTVTQPTTLSLIDTIINVSCNGGSDGSIALTVLGGVSPYTYLWSNASTTSSINALAAGSYNVTVTDANSATATGTYTVNEPTAITTSAVVLDATTFGGADGSIDLTVSGGTPNYSFLWSTAAITEDISSLSAGTYTVTVTDANACSAVDSFVVSQPAGSLANLVITEIMYNGPEAGTDTSEFIEFVNVGNTAVDLAGYSFSQGVTFTFPQATINPGQYVVVAFDSSGFRNTYGINADFVWASGGLSNGGEDITIVDNFNRTIDSVDFDDSMPWPSGSGAGEVDGGGASLVLCDSTADNNVGSNWFAATSPINGVIVNGLQVFANPGVGAPCVQSLVATITIDSSVTCNGGLNGGLTANVTSGAAPISFIWSNSDTTASITGLAAGTYTVTITDANATTLVDSAVITEPAAISITSVIVDQTLAGNDGSIDLTVSGGTAPYAFLWNTADTTEDLSGLNAGVYTVNITDSNNCVFVDSVTVGLSTGIAEVSLKNNLSIYPNPSNGLVTIKTAAKYQEINVLDMTGKVILTANDYELIKTIDLSSRQKGIYFIAIQGESERVIKKLIIH
jgi:hypothetical protein